MESYSKSLVDKKIEEIKAGRNSYEIGLVTAVKEYILTVRGLENAVFMERVLIGNGAEGYVNAIRRSEICVTVVKSNGPVFIGDQVRGTGETYKAAFALSSFSRVVDMFGRDRMTDQVLEDAEPIAIENEPISIMDRGKVCRPLETGIAGIDLIYPIGKGQRQLIIGDKKTGKTQITLDAIANQKGKNMVCIYVAIGKTKKQVKRVYQELLAKGCMSYTIILAAFNDDTPPVLYLTPYVAASIAEKFMMEGNDVLLVLDDHQQIREEARAFPEFVGVAVHKRQGVVTRTGVRLDRIKAPDRSNRPAPRTGSLKAFAFDVEHQGRPLIAKEGGQDVALRFALAGRRHGQQRSLSGVVDGFPVRVRAEWQAVGARMVAEDCRARCIGA